MLHFQPDGTASPLVTEPDVDLQQVFGKEFI